MSRFTKKAILYLICPLMRRVLAPSFVTMVLDTNPYKALTFILLLLLLLQSLLRCYKLSFVLCSFLSLVLTL
jgi:hypothetical protein